MRDFVQKAFSDLARKIGLMSFVLLFISFAFASQASAAIVINEIYSGGGNASATFNQDFVELYNNGATAVDISGYSLQYLSGNSTANFAVCTITATDTVIEPGTYFLISTSAVGAIGNPLPTPNANCNSFGPAAGSGKFALLSNSSALSGATCPPVAPGGATIIDFVGYGTTANVNCFEGMGPAIAPLANTGSIQRIGMGQDTNDNTADFARLATPTPTAGGLNPTVSLTVTPATASETGQTQLTATVTATAAVVGDQTVNFTLTSGTAGTADFLSIPATITILSGQTTGTATFNVFDDSLVESTESATFTISSPSSGITLGAVTTATVDITDNDAAALPDLTISQSGPSSATTGSSFDYTLRVGNNGTADQLVDVNFILPMGVTFNTASALNGCTSIDLVSGVVQFRGCAATANSSNIFFTVNVTAPLTPQTITSAGTNAVVDPNSLIAESNETNNAASATVTTNVTAAPTAATVSLSGQVTTTGGRGIMNIRLSLTDSQGNVRTTTTDSSGHYRFDDVQAGETYILTATGKGYSFSQPVQVLSINEEANQVNFIANSEKRLRVF
jgi:hypothetical protein